MDIGMLSIGEMHDFFPISDTIPPTLAPDERVKQFENEQDVVNYMVDHILQIRRGTTQKTLAAEMGSQAWS